MATGLPQPDARRASGSQTMTLDPPLRGARGRDVRAGEDRRLPASVDRRGGHDRGQRAGAARDRLSDLHLPLTRPRAGARHAAGERDGRAVRARRRLLGGRGGSMHMFDLARRFMGGYGIVGGNLPIAAGIALASDYKGTDEVTLCTFGDGASNQGTFGETLNLAALWRLPVVFMVTNNQFGMGTRSRRHSAVTDLQRKGESLGVPGMRCDGMDVLDTHAVISRGRASACARTASRCSSRPSPTAFAATRWPTRRSTAPRRRSRSWRERDPIPAFGELLEREGVSTRTIARIDERGGRARGRGGGVRRGLAVPAPESLYDDVYVLDDAVRGSYSVGPPRPEEADAGRSGGRRRRRREIPSRSPPRCRPARAAPDGRAALPRGAERGAARGAQPRRARGADGRGHRRVRRGLQGHRGTAGGVRRAARARHADLREHDRGRGRGRRDDAGCARWSS